MRRLGIGFFAARSPCQRARRGCPSIGPLDASEASMALPTALLSDASRRWRGGELDWCFATRGCSVNESSVYHHLGLHRARVLVGSWSCVVLSAGLSCRAQCCAAARINCAQNSTHFIALSRGPVGRLARRPRRVASLRAFSKHTLSPTRPPKSLGLV